MQSAGQHQKNETTMKTIQEIAADFAALVPEKIGTYKIDRAHLVIGGCPENRVVLWHRQHMECGPTVEDSAKDLLARIKQAEAEQGEVATLREENARLRAQLEESK
jgi:hypothetical protein